MGKAIAKAFAGIVGVGVAVTGAVYSMTFAIESMQEVVSAARDASGETTKHAAAN